MDFLEQSSKKEITKAFLKEFIRTNLVNKPFYQKAFSGFGLVFEELGLMQKHYSDFYSVVVEEAIITSLLVLLERVELTCKSPEEIEKFFSSNEEKVEEYIGKAYQGIHMTMTMMLSVFSENAKEL